LDSTIKAASLFAAGQTAAAGLVSAKVVALTEGVLQTMLLTKISITVAVLLVIGALGIGASGLPYRTAAAEPPSPEFKSAARGQDDAKPRELPKQQADKDRSDPLIEAVFERVARRQAGMPSAKYDVFVELATWKLMAVHAAKRTVSLRWSEVIALEGLSVAADAQVVVDGQEKQLGDLKPGMWITPKLDPGRTRIAKIVATSKEVDLYVVWSVNAEQSIIKVRLGGFGVEFPVAKDARITVNKEQVKLADLQPGMRVALDLGVTDNRIAVKTIRGRR
jgi:hypothetical protein